MSLSEQIQLKFFDKDAFTMNDVYEVIPDKPRTTLRARIYDNLGIKFEKISRNLYRTIKDNCQCMIIEGDGRDLSMLEDNSVDCIITDHPWEDRANKGGNRNFALYPTFNYTYKDFTEKARVLKEGSFLVEILPEEKETNYVYLYKIKKMAEENGLQYYAKVTWKKGTFVSNTGRKAKNSEDVMIFSKGKPRELRIDAKKTKALGVTTYMSGTNKMLPTEFNIQAVPVSKKINQAEKPVALYEQIIDYITQEGELIVDQFAGSGSLGVAALNKHRNCILIEKVKENIEKIKERFIKTFGTCECFSLI